MKENKIRKEFILKTQLQNCFKNDDGRELFNNNKKK